MNKIFILIALLFLAGNLQANPVLQDDGSFVITAVPVTLNEPGNYKLKKGTYAGTGRTTTAIWIKAENVVLDLNHAILDNNPEDPYQPGNSTAVFAEGKNIVIKNGIIRNFGNGISYSYRDPKGRSDEHLTTSVIIENNFISHCRVRGIVLGGLSNGVIVRNNRIVGTSEYITGAGDFPYPIGEDIYVIGSNNQIVDNILINRSENPHLVGIRFTMASHNQEYTQNNLIIGNTINNHKRAIGGPFNNYAWGFYKGNTIINSNHNVTGGTSLD